MKIDESKIYVSGLFEDGTEGDNVEQIINMLTYPTNGELDISAHTDNGKLYLSCEPTINISVTESESVKDMYNDCRDTLVKALQSMIDTLKATEPTTKEEWEQLVQEWEKE